MKKVLRYCLLLCLISSLTGCVYWFRAYQTYVQMDQFDKYFDIVVDDEFSIYFKQPILLSDDFISLSKLQPSVISDEKNNNKSWRYWFTKVDQQGNISEPETKFYFNLLFNKDQHLIRWTFSPLFLQIAPAEFLEVSIRSLGGANINKFKRQLKVDTNSVEKIMSDLPQKSQVLSQLGEPLQIDNKDTKDVYIYHFQLQTNEIEEGYEDRALSVVKLTFDKQSDELIKMAGRFIGLKLSINYRKYLKQKDSPFVQMAEQVIAND